MQIFNGSTACREQEMCKHPSPKTLSIHLRTAQFSAKSISTTGTINLRWMKNLER